MPYTLQVRSGFRLSLAHLVVFVVVVLVLNAQFTWWIMYSVRQNRTRLEVERELIGMRARLAARQLELLAERAASEIVLTHVAGAGKAGAPFLEVDEIPLRSSVTPGELVPSARNDIDTVRSGWSQDAAGRQIFSWTVDDGSRYLAVLDPQVPYRWLAGIDPRVNLAAAREGRSGPRPVSLESPFTGLVVIPDVGRWQTVLGEYRRRVLLVVAEGGLFFAAMIATVIALWTVLQRESVLQRQSQNFISAVTHELKTPIAGIRVALETVLRGRADPEGAQRFLGNALLDVERLSSLVEKVLEVTRFAGGAHRLRIVVDDLSELVEGEIEAAERRARARGVEIDAEIEPGISAPIDAEAMAIVVSNLLENAVKYAAGPPPRVTASLRLSDGDAVVEISDNGIGISEDDRERIFDAFYRAGDEVTRRTPGTGIGLYVAREIVDAHGGRLRALSKGRGKGATFRMTLPGAGEFADEELAE